MMMMMMMNEWNVYRQKKNHDIYVYRDPRCSLCLSGGI